MNGPPTLRHENLHVYQAAIEFLALAARLDRPLKRGFYELADQFRRAALSIPLNIAEGCGRRQPGDRKRFYDIARGSAHECGAVLDAAKVMELVTESDFSEGKTLLHRIVSMLVKMVAQ